MKIPFEQLKWIEYQPEGEYVPMSNFGKDHWSTFAYLETLCVDPKGERGLIDNRKMRVNPRLHRQFANGQDGSGYTTRTKSDNIQRHDDFSCLEDLVANKLISAWSAEMYEGEVFGHMVAKVELTALGHVVAGQLREHKALGGNYQDFDPDLAGVEISADAKA